MPIQPLQIPGYTQPTPIDFSSLGNLPQVYQKARDEANTRMTLANLGQGIQNGNVDYTQAAGQALSSGNAQLGMSLLQLGEQQKKQKLELEASKNFSNQVGGMFGQPAAQPAAPQSAGPYAGAIAGIESGGKYDALGPVTQDGDRAYGKYQVMGKNVGPWTQEILGKPMTPQEFASSPQAQDAVFKAKFGSYAQKYGPEGAAKAWFAGEGGMNNPNAKDMLGTSVSSYTGQFNRGMGQPGTQVASLGNIGIPSGADGSSPLDTASWPAGPINSPGPIVSGDGQSPLDNAQWPAGPVGAPGSNNTQVAQAQQPQQQAPSAGPAQVLPPALMQDPTTARIGQLLAASVHPNLPAAQKEVAKTLLTHALKASELTSDQKEYIGAVAQGEKATFTDWMRGNKKAGATAITIDQKGESKFEEEFGKKQADRWIGYMTNADAARKKMVDVNTMRKISGRLGSQGAAAGVKEAIGPYAEALGVNIDGLSDIQAYTQVIQRLAPQQRAPGSGSTSDIEFKGFVKSLPGLSQNPAAREMGLNTMEALSRDDMARGEIASKLATGEIKRSQAEYELRALPDPMKGFVEWRKANPELYGISLKGGPAPASAAPNPQSGGKPPIEGSRQAPDGNWYIQKDGKTYRVDP